MPDSLLLFKSRDKKTEDYTPLMANPTFSDQIPISFPMMQQNINNNDMFYDIPPSNDEAPPAHFNNNLGFMEMLGFQDDDDFSYPTSIWDMVINDHSLLVPVPPPPQQQPSSVPPSFVVPPSQQFSHPPPLLMSPTSEVVNMTSPVTPNSSLSFSSSYGAEGGIAPPPNAELVEDQEKFKKLLKAQKKNQRKKLKEGRYAFKTKSEVEHLEDGYRWRKYGQKAVKNSPFPRSYYRCTTAGCSVKKRIERSPEDSTIVVTTYEGVHTHHSPMGSRGNLGLLGPVLGPIPNIFNGGGNGVGGNAGGDGPYLTPEMLNYQVQPQQQQGAGGDGSFSPHLTPEWLNYQVQPQPQVQVQHSGAGSSYLLMPEMMHYHQQPQVQVQVQPQQQQAFYQQGLSATLNFNGTNAYDNVNVNVNVNPMNSFANLVEERRIFPSPSTIDDGLLQDILPSKMLIKNPTMQG